MRNWMIAASMVLTLAGCGQGDQGQIEQLQKEIAVLQAKLKTAETALDDERNGAVRLLAVAKNELESGAAAKAKQALLALVERHPGAEQAKEAKALIAELDRKAAQIEEEKRREEARKAEEQRKLIARAEQNLRKEVDEVREITWLSHKKEPALGKKVSLYFGTKNGSASTYPLRMKLQYSADDWLFVRSVTVKAGEKTIELRTGNFERDHSSGTILEWADQPVTDFKMLDEILARQKVIIRFNGNQYYSDFTLPESQKAAMREVLLAWERYGGKRS